MDSTVSFTSSLDQMAESHWTGCVSNQDPIVGSIGTVVTSPPTQYCKMTLQIPRNS